MSEQSETDQPFTDEPADVEHTGGEPPMSEATATTTTPPTRDERTDENDRGGESPGFFARLGRMFRRGGRVGATDLSVPDDASPSGALVSRAVVRPWGRNGQAISQLQHGFQNLTDLMGTIRENLEAQNARQDLLIQHLSTLPRLLEMLPEANKIQGETLKAIHQQLVHQADQQEVLGEILEKMSEAGGENKEVLEGLRERVENLGNQDRAMADSLNAVGAAMESVSKNSQASAEVLGQVRDNLRSRDSELERVLHRQASKFTTMLAIAIFLSIAALAAVVVMGYLMMKQMQH